MRNLDVSLVFLLSISISHQFYCRNLDSLRFYGMNLPLPCSSKNNDQFYLFCFPNILQFPTFKYNPQCNTTRR